MSEPSLPLMRERRCAICSAKANKTWMKADVNFAALDGFAFASRKLPEYMHFDLALCEECDLVFANAVPEMAWFQDSYRDANFDAENESKYAALTYANALKEWLPLLPTRHSALDIGAGDGAFVEALQGLGFKHVIGVEPSKEPVQRATPATRALIRNDFFRAEDFEENTFDLVTCFQTLEHLEDPLSFVNDAKKLLRPGGILMTVAHDFRAPLARLLGARSPIYDIEHLQLFSAKSLDRLYQHAGFSAISVSSLRNAYPVNYWLRLLPLPLAIKGPLLRHTAKSMWGKKIVAAKVGNLVACGRKPLENGLRSIDDDLA